ncbi:hypothetical protein D3C71_1824200 [compost metagenome]
MTHLDIHRVVGPTQYICTIVSALLVNQPGHQVGFNVVLFSGGVFVSPPYADLAFEILTETFLEERTEVAGLDQLDAKATARVFTDVHFAGGDIFNDEDRLTQCGCRWSDLHVYLTEDNVQDTDPIITQF